MSRTKQLASLLWSVVVALCAVAQARAQVGAHRWIVDQDTATLNRLDLAGDTSVVVALTGTGFAVATARDGSAWVGVDSPPRIVHVTTAGAIDVEIASDYPVESLAIAADGSLWAVVPSTGAVARYTADGEWLADYAVGSLPYGVAIATDQQVWVTNAYGNSVTRIEPASGATVEFAVGFYPTGIAAHPDGRIWIAEKEGITVLDADGSVFAELSAGVYPRGIAVALDGDVWVSNQNSGTVSHFAADTTWLGEYGVGGLPWGIAAAGDQTISVLCRAPGAVWQLDDAGVVRSIVEFGYPNSFGDLTGLALALTVSPTSDFDGDGAANQLEAGSLSDPMSALSQPPRFVRGDVDRDQRVAVEDALAILTHLFAEAELPSVEAADVDDDAVVGVADAVVILDYLFTGGEAPSAPFPTIGFDPTP